MNKILFIVSLAAAVYSGGAQAAPNCNKAAQAAFQGIAEAFNRIASENKFKVKAISVEADSDRELRYKANLANQNTGETVNYVLHLSPEPYTRCIPLRLEMGM